MPTKPAAPGLLTGLALQDLSAPPAATPRGGMEFGFDGSSDGPAPQRGDSQPSQDLGSWLTEDDATVFKTADELVLRQEIPAINRWEIDRHFRHFKIGYQFSLLEYDTKNNTVKCSLPAGTKISTQAVPNQAWDLVNKATEAILVDPPQFDPAPLNDSEEAHAAAEMAERFLTEDGGENGTNDIRVFYDALDKALVGSTAYIEAFVDPVAGGYVPLQILAHPDATDPSNPLIGPDGMPTANNILRYVTAPEGGQFTDVPADAAPQWQPKIIEKVWGREHWRVYPESVTVDQAEKVIGLLYCTIAEAKRRWPTVAQMSPDEVSALVGWMPTRGLILLPPFQRARWQMANGPNTEKSGSSDERIIFYYRVLQKAMPDHPQGAEVIVSGYNGGTILDRKPLSARVSVPTEKGAQDELRCMDLPLVQLTPRADPDDRDPTGRCYMELFCGAVEMNATLLTGFLQALNIWLNPDSYVVSTSSVEGEQVEESRATGDAIPIIKAEDKPTYGNMPPLPNSFPEIYSINDQAIRSIASLTKPVTGQDNSQEVSGKARQIAVQQGMIGLSRMQHPTNAAFERYGRIKLQLAMRDFSTPQVVRYVGDDGAWMEQQWKGTDFALVGSVGIQAGTGTMMPPEQKTQFLANLKAEGLLPADEVNDAARPTFAQRLGLPDNPHEQAIERAIAAWLKGPPEGWVEQWQAYQQALAAYQQQMAAYQAAQAALQQQAQANQQQQITAQQHAAAIQTEQQKADIQRSVEDHKHQLAMLRASAGVAA